MRFWIFNSFQNTIENIAKIERQKKLDEIPAESLWYSSADKNTIGPGVDSSDPNRLGSSRGSTRRTFWDVSVWNAGIGDSDSWCRSFILLLLLLLCWWLWLWRATKTLVGPPLPPLIFSGAIVTSNPETGSRSTCASWNKQCFYLKLQIQIF